MRSPMLPLVLPVLAPAAFAQQFVHDVASSPANAGNYTSDVDFADVDNDGDWDAAFANGGDFGSLQNALWVNQGFAQGGTLGAFLDATAARLPAVLDQSREVEFADIDGDGDVDLHSTNTAQFVNQPSRFWVNQGGVQGGSIGFFVDETSTRWVGLGGPGSSIAPALVLGSGGFIDFGWDTEFGDLDDDGDLDLVHSTAGNALVGNTPTRLFLNDGAGHFVEFNPAGVHLTGETIPNGSLGIWCEGIQTANTTNATGAQCDVATSAIDVDVADVDGDLDLDFLLGSRQEFPRLFQNRMQETGAFSWRDVTGAAFSPGYSTAQGHYEQEFGDFDFDGDLDVYGLNWLVTFSSFNDATYANDGAGHFAAGVVIAGSGPDENEVDVFDYDLDGDVDAFLSNYSGQDAVCRNDGAGPLVRQTTTVLPADSTTSLDAAAADVDHDGDFDLIVANDGTGTLGNEWYLRNTTAAIDVTAPALFHLEQAPNRLVGPAPTVVRVQIQDNSPIYVTAGLTATLVVRVNGSVPTLYPLRCSGGQVFRGTIPGSLAGVVTYSVVATDEHGNTGTTAEKSYTASNPAAGVPFCLGDGSGGPCPCGNLGAGGNGCANSSNAAGALLAASGATANDSIVLSASGMPATASAIFLKGDQGLDLGLVFGDGVRCVDGALIRLRTKTSVGGASQFPDSTDTLTVGGRGATPPGSGLVGYYQTYYRNAAAAFCPPATFNVTNGTILVW